MSESINVNTREILRSVGTHEAVGSYFHSMEPKTTHTATEEVQQDEKRISIWIFFITKIVELMLAIFSVGLIVDPYRHMRETDVNHAGLTYVAYGACIITCIIFLVGRLMGEILPLRVMLLFSLVHGILLIAAGSVIIADWSQYRTRIILLQPKQYMDMMVSSGVFSLLNGIVHFVDIGFTIKFS